MRFRMLWILAIAVALVGGPAWGGSRSAVDVRPDTGDRIVLDCKPGSFVTSSTMINGHRFERLRLESEGTTKVIGAPALPTVCRSVIVPDDMAMALTVVDARFYEVENVNIAPSRGYILRSGSPDGVPYTFGEAYATDAFWPEALATMRSPHVMRDHRGVVVEFHPFQYNPKSGVLRVYTELAVELKPIGPDKDPRVPRRPARPVCRAFDELYAAHFVNYESAIGMAPAMDERGDLLIITADGFEPELAPLVAHKTARGISTTVVSMSTIGVNDEIAIKSYIQSAYDSGDVSFVLLVGDATTVATPIVSGGPADALYSLLEGDDSYPDLFVGRFSAESVDDVETQVQRTIEYEQMVLPEEDWTRRAMGIGSNEDEGALGELDREHIEDIRVRLLDRGYLSVDQVYDPEASDDAVVDGLNAGRGLVNYCGHGSWNGWSTAEFSSQDVYELTNIGQLPLIVSCACNVGRFDALTCFGESWLRATSEGQPIGAAGIYASSVGQYWDPPKIAQDEINDLLLSGTYHGFGSLCYAGSCKMMDEYPGPGAEFTGGGEEMFQTWILFGDPSLHAVDQHGLVVVPSSSLRSTGNVGGPFSPSTAQYVLRNFDPTPIDFEATTGAAWLELTPAAGTVPGGGEVIVEVSVGAAAAGLGRGMYTGMIHFANTTDQTDVATRQAYLSITRTELIYATSLDTDPGWARDGEWAFGQPTGNGGVLHGYPDPVGGASGDNAFGANLDGDYVVSVGGPYYLTTEAFDCTGLVDVELHFQRWLNTDYPPFASATIEISNDTTTWWPVWSVGNNPSGLTENAWSQQVYDISAVADDQPAVCLRWGYSVGSLDAYALSGWNIDDIRVWGTVQGIPGDLNDDDAVDLQDFAVFVDCMAGPNHAIQSHCASADFDGDGDIDMTDFNQLADLLGD